MHSETVSTPLRRRPGFCRRFRQRIMVCVHSPVAQRGDYQVAQRRVIHEEDASRPVGYGATAGERPANLRRDSFWTDYGETDLAEGTT
jgi:hypothetical protein